jgi:hypothetical protein
MFLDKHKMASKPETSPLLEVNLKSLAPSVDLKGLKHASISPDHSTLALNDKDGTISLRSIQSRAATSNEEVILDDMIESLTIVLSCFFEIAVGEIIKKKDLDILTLC